MDIQSSDEIVEKSSKLNETLMSFNDMDCQLAATVKFLNEDFCNLGLKSIVECQNNVVSLSIERLIKYSAKLVDIYKERLKMFEQLHDNNKFLTSEITRLEKTIQRKHMDYEELARNYEKTRNSNKDLEQSIDHLSSQLKSEKTAKRVSDSNYDKEKTTLKTEKLKLERELNNLKERLGKLLVDPKRQYPTINVTNSKSASPAHSSRSNSRTNLNRSNISSTSCSQSDLKEDQISCGDADEQLSRQLISSLRIQLQDVAMENHDLRHILAQHLHQVELMPQQQYIPTPPLILTNYNNPMANREVETNNSAVDLDADVDDDPDITATSDLNRFNNRSFSITSVASTFSIRSNQTFVMADKSKHSPGTSIQSSKDMKMLTDMPFHLIKDSVEQRLHDALNNIRIILQESDANQRLNSGRCTPVGHQVTAIGSVPLEGDSNMTHMQRQISELRHQLTDYQQLIQKKDLIIEGAIQQRIPSGNLKSQ